MDDALEDGDMAYTVVIAAATSGDSQYQGINPADVTLSNLDNEPEPGCSSPPATVELLTGFPTGYCLCIGDDKIMIKSGVNFVIGSSATVELRSPVVEFFKGFAVEAGGVLSVTKP